MGMVSLATVVSFESVGAIMVISLLVGPAATAALFARSLPAMIILASLIGILAGICGYLLAGWLNAAIAGAIATVIGVFFFLGLLVKRVLRG